MNQIKLVVKAKKKIEFTALQVILNTMVKITRIALNRIKQGY
jgi:hypothetical protein